MLEMKHALFDLNLSINMLFDKKNICLICVKCFLYC